MLKRIFLVFFLLFGFVDQIEGIRRRHIYPTGLKTDLKANDDPGEPLFLTPYLEKGQIDEARRLR